MNTLNDLQEHLRVTKESLQIVSEELGTLLFQRDEVKQDLESRQLLVKESVDRLKELNKKINLEKLRGDEEVHRNKEELQDVLTQIKASKIELKEIKNTTSGLNNTVPKLNSEITKLNEVKISILNEIESNLFTKEQLLNKLNVLELERLHKEEKLLSQDNELAKYESKKARIIKDFDLFVELNNQKIEEEKKKIDGPMKLLEETTLQLEKREKNLMILSTRFRNKFEKAFPGQQVII